MLSVTSYPPEFIDGCRERVRDQVSAYRELEDAARAAALRSDAAAPGEGSHDQPLA